MFSRRIILASSSERRKAIMHELGIEFEICVSQAFKERMSLNGGTATRLVIENALGKAQEIA